mgnify:CR=1 FL=1
MKKFIAVAALFAMIFTGASAQFEAGTKYIGASLSVFNTAQTNVCVSISMVLPVFS